MIHLSRFADGSAMILALLLVAVMGVLAAGWITLISARSGVAEQTHVASQRRIALENSKALAQEFMLERVITSTSGNPFEYGLTPTSLGGFTIEGWASPAMLSVQKSKEAVYQGYNHFSPGNGDGYTLDLATTVRDGESGFSRKYQVRSRSPLLAGTLLSSQAPPLTDTSISIGRLNVDVTGGAFVWKPGLSMTFTSESYSAPNGAAAVTFTDSSNSVLTMNNLALPCQIANPRTSGSFYTGEFDAIDNPNLAANSSRDKATSGGGITILGSQVHPAPPAPPDGIVCDGAGNITITPDTLGLANVYIPGVIRSLTLQGQANVGNIVADDRPAMLIVVNGPGATFLGITLNQHNSRRLVLAIKNTATVPALPVQFTTASASWRLLLEAENTPVSITASGTATIKGGIRSDSTIALTGNAQITLETDPKNLERLATRAGWIESFAQ